MIIVILRLQMIKRNRTYNFTQLLSAVLFIMALAWLTVSSSFVYAAQQERAKLQNTEKAAPLFFGGEEETNNPPGNNGEEKAPGGNTISEEFIHDHHTDTHYSCEGSQYHKGENADIYIAFHGELLVPPPNGL